MYCIAGNVTIVLFHFWIVKTNINTDQCKNDGVFNIEFDLKRQKQ